LEGQNVIEPLVSLLHRHGASGTVRRTDTDVDCPQSLLHHGLEQLDVEQLWKLR
jgi:hypothetical protein